MCDNAKALERSSFACEYALSLLRDVGFDYDQLLPTADHPAVSWARSGLMEITGHEQGPPLICPVALSACADGALTALRALGDAPTLEGIAGSSLLGERARLMGFSRKGMVSAGGSCRLLETADGVIAANLARDEDWYYLSAWLEEEVGENWPSLARAVRSRSTAVLVTRARLIGLAIAPDESPARQSSGWFRRRNYGTCREPGKDKPARVVDLSSLWAGPLCAQLLQALGAQVIKVESCLRPDGARLGDARFYDLLNAGKLSVMLDFSRSEDLQVLTALIDSADIVIESSRPRALYQLGIRADDAVARGRGLTWVSVTAYGRGGDAGNWVGFGDDTGVAAGLASCMYEAHGERLFAGDAVADPLTGLHAALVAWASYRLGGGSLVELSLRDIVAHCISADGEADRAVRALCWQKIGMKHRTERYPLRRPAQMAAAVGADTEQVLGQLMGSY